MGENFNFGLSVTALGMGFTFLVLMLLSLSIVLMNKIFDRLDQKKQTILVASPQKNEVAVGAAVEQREVVQSLSETASGPNGLSGQLVAVISAAVAAVMGKNIAEIQIASFRKVGQGGSAADAWSQAGRLEVMNSRQILFNRKGK